MGMARLLVTNDDGIFATGLRTLVTHLLAAGHEVMVVAPDRERSATSHALTLHDPLRAFEHGDLLAQGCSRAYAVTGTPVDCVKLAVHHLLANHPPDAVISGINHGPNLGSDIVYSGTVSAALEAAHYNLFSLAISHAGGYLPDAVFDPAAGFLTEQLPMLLSHPIPPHTVLNINVPPAFSTITVTTLSQRMYHNFYEHREDPRKKGYFWLDGCLMDANDPPESDAAAVKRGEVSITPVRMDWLDVNTYQALQQAYNVAV
jgi:5'-nucleotidase